MELSIYYSNGTFASPNPLLLKQKDLGFRAWWQIKEKGSL